MMWKRINRGVNLAEKMVLITICSALGILWTGSIMLQRLAKDIGKHPPPGFRSFCSIGPLAQVLEEVGDGLS